ncbi:MAG: OmpA family protein [Cyanobacteria bacterium SZAS TMP-1]|nr:OmpA family protein [Cyanobacteria bacterium SZAS TMP-1]
MAGVLLLAISTPFVTTAALAGEIVVIKGQRYEKNGDKLYPQQDASWTDLQGVVHPNWITDYSTYRAPEFQPNFKPQHPNFQATSAAVPQKPEPPPFQIVDSGKKHLVTIGADTLFDFDKATLTPRSEKVLARLGPVLKKYGSCSVSIAGHTDNIGSEEYNQDLSERRATTVRDWLAAHDFIAADASITGYGERQPLARNTLPDGQDYPPGRARNRRVEITLESIEPVGTAEAAPTKPAL